MKAYASEDMLLPLKNELLPLHKIFMTYLQGKTFFKTVVNACLMTIYQTQHVKEFSININKKDFEWIDDLPDHPWDISNQKQSKQGESDWLERGWPKNLSGNVMQ